MRNIFELIQQCEEAGVKSFGGSMFEDVSTLDTVQTNKTDCQLVDNNFGKKQLKLSANGKTIFAGIVSVKNAKGDFVQPVGKTKFQLVLRRVKEYGESTRQWLVDNNINPENLAPGTTFLHARAV